MNFSKALAYAFVAMLSVLTLNAKDLELWYEQPAGDWMMEANPIGNGFLGAMFFGKVEEERIQFNEESLWTGGKGSWKDYNFGNVPGAYKHLPEVRKLIDQGEFGKAHNLARRKLAGKIKKVRGRYFEGFGAYQAFGDLFVKTSKSKAAKNYRRSLNISQGLGAVDFEAEGVKHRRQYFASHPKRALVFKFSNDSSTGVDYSVRYETPHHIEKQGFANKTWTLSGWVTENKMEYEARFLIDTDGEYEFKNNQLQVKGAKYLTIYLSAATDYVNEYPVYKGRDYKALNDKVIAKLESSNYDAILAEHKADFSRLHGRVSMTLSQDDKSDLPTDKRLKAYQNGHADPNFEALYFQFGRYLLMSSSREGSMPANLQGKWNDRTEPAWACDYHSNINVQMIYWATELGNLAECHKPLIDYVDKLRAPGRQSAKDFFNARGWIVNTANNPFGFTAPGWGFPWGFFPAGAAWYGRHIWDHYDYSRDLNYLEKTAYPIMKDSALFWLDYLTKDKDNFLVSSPSYSPEHGGISGGAYMDIQIVWDLFTNLEKAHKALKINDEFSKQISQARKELLPLRIGRWGQLQEWKEDRDDPKNIHRHVSHMYAVYPGSQIDYQKTPKYAEAARVSMDARGDSGTGWAMGWKMNIWARLQDGDRAHKLLTAALTHSKDSGWGKQRNMKTGGGVYSNLLSTHPPFQLDGNMGAAAGIAEMLMQSHGDVIQVLPALPKKWATGEVSGLRARGGYEVSIKWSNGQLVSVEVKAVVGGSVKLKYKDTVADMTLKKGEDRKFDSGLKSAK